MEGPRRLVWAPSAGGAEDGQRGGDGDRAGVGRYGRRPPFLRLQLAELLLEHYPDERADAIEHLDFAIGEFQEMKMQPSLEQALRHRELLKA